MDLDLPEGEKELAELGIFTPIEKRFDENKNPYWVVPNQKILIQDSKKLPPGLTIEPPRSLLLRVILSFVELVIMIVTFGFVKKLSKTTRSNEIQAGSKFTGTFTNFPEKKVQLTVVRVSECPNDKSEYGLPTISVLVEWPRRRFDSPPGDLVTYPGLVDQSDNIFIINPETNNKPGPPIADAFPSPQSVSPTDFKIFDYGTIPVISDKLHYEPLANENFKWPIVAVMDTGLVYKWEHQGQRGRSYPRNGQQINFIIANAQTASCLPNAAFGYCGVTDYLKKPVRIPQLLPLRNYSTQEILVSPYDDNLVDEKVNGILNKRRGRHGTIISAIINYLECKVLPVKVFNCAGFGTLFDILCGCNYVISRKIGGDNIKVLNASFSGSLNAQGRLLFRNKIIAITELHGIWVVAAAGNQHFDLGLSPLYPAQWGLPVSQGGLEKVITVTSAYNNGVTVGNFGSPVSIKAKSPLPDGFPSALPIVNNDSIKGTSFAAPYVAAVLAHSGATTRVAALDYLRNHPVPSPFIRPASPEEVVPSEIEFVNPIP